MRSKKSACHVVVQSRIDGMSWHVPLVDSIRLTLVNSASFIYARGMSWCFPGDNAHCPSLALSPSSGAPYRAGADAEISPLKTVWRAMSSLPQAGGSGAQSSLARHVICVVCSWQDNRSLMDASLAGHVMLLLLSSILRSATRPHW